MRNQLKAKIPRHCRECEHFQGSTTEWGKKYGFDTCTAQGFSAPTYDFVNPLDMPMPPVINCVYMEQNRVFKGLPDRKREGYFQERVEKLRLNPVKEETKCK